MSTRWADAIVFNGEFNRLSEGLSEVPMPDGWYICMICNKVTLNFNKVCSKCEDPNGGDCQDD